MGFWIVRGIVGIVRWGWLGEGWAVSLSIGPLRAFCWQLAFLGSCLVPRLVLTIEFALIIY